MALTRDLIAGMLADLRQQAPSLEWRIRTIEPGPDEYDIAIELAGARDVMIWLLEGNDDARVLVDEFTFDHIMEGHLRSFLAGVLDIGPASDAPTRGADEVRGLLIVRNRAMEWRS